MILLCLRKLMVVFLAGFMLRKKLRWIFQLSLRV
ncbi:hypothetical protein ABIC30_006176 [Methylobacterium sp. 1030]